MEDHPDQGKATALRGIRGRMAKRLAIAWVLLSLLVGGVMAFLEFRKADDIAFGLAASVVDSLQERRMSPHSLLHWSHWSGRATCRQGSLMALEI